MPWEGEESMTSVELFLDLSSLFVCYSMCDFETKRIPATPGALENRWDFTGMKILHKNC